LSLANTSNGYVTVHLIGQLKGIDGSSYRHDEIGVLCDSVRLNNSSKPKFFALISVG
jgi:hypothetical protein